MTWKTEKQAKRSSHDIWVNKMHHILQRSQSHKITEDRMHVFTENVQSGWFYETEGGGQAPEARAARLGGGTTG